MERFWKQLTLLFKQSSLWYWEEPSILLPSAVDMVKHKVNNNRRICKIYVHINEDKIKKKKSHIYTENGKFITTHLAKHTRYNNLQITYDRNEMVVAEKCLPKFCTHNSHTEKVQQMHSTVMYFFMYVYKRTMYVQFVILLNKQNNVHLYYLYKSNQW